MTIELAELMKEWERIARENEDRRSDREGFLTTEEYSEIWGVGKDKTRKILAEFENRGRLEARCVSERVLGGQMGHRRVYRVTPEKGKGK